MILGPGSCHFGPQPKCINAVKGQINSEWIYEIINFSKNDPKNLKDFCLMYHKNSQGRNPARFHSDLI